MKIKKRMIESIVYSIMDLGGMLKVVILVVNGEIPDGYNKVLDKSIGINKNII